MRLSNEALGADGRAFADLRSCMSRPSYFNFLVRTAKKITLENQMNGVKRTVLTPYQRIQLCGVKTVRFTQYHVFKLM